MINANSMKINMTIDSYNQWFISVWVIKDDAKVLTRFKIDTGCNAMEVLRQFSNVAFNLTGERYIELRLPSFPD